MIGDLINLFKAVQSAQTDQDKADRQHELDLAVQAEIRSLFDDPRYPERRRTIGAIRKSIPVSILNDEELERSLFLMNARVKSADDVAPHV